MVESTASASFERIEEKEEPDDMDGERVISVMAGRVVDVKPPIKDAFHCFNS